MKPMRLPFPVIGAFAAPWALWAVFRATDTWQSAFFDTGLVVVADNIARLALLVVLVEACRGIGWLAGARAGTVDSDLLGIATGFAISHIVGGVIGYLGLLSPLIACLYVGVGLALATRSAPFYFRRDGFARLAAIDRVALAGALALALVFVVVRILPLDLQNNDFSHYFPYYEWVRERGLTFPSWYFINAYYLKGAGLNHLAVQVSDPAGAQLVGGLAIVLIALATGRLATRLAGDSLAVGLVVGALVTVSSSLWLLVELEKAHALISALLVALVLMAAMDAEQALERWQRRAAAIVAFAVPFMLPVAAIFLVPFCGLFVLNAWRRGEGFVLSLQPIAAAIAALVGTLAFTHLLSGMPEFSPLRVMLSLRNDAAMRPWIDPAAILWFQAYGAQTFDVQLDPFSLIRSGAFAFCFGALIASVVAFFLLRRRGGLALATLIASFLSFSIFLAIKQVFPGQDTDLDRFSAFFPSLVYLSTLAAIALALGFWKPASIAGIALSLLATAVVADQLATQTKYYVRPLDAALRQASGSLSRDAAIHGPYPAGECAAAAKLVPAGSQVLPMGIRPGCYVWPGVRFQRPEMNPLTLAFSDTLFGAPETARKAFLDRGVAYVVISSAPSYVEIPAPQAFSPLFRPENLAKHFRIVGKLDAESWLLTLKEEGKPVDRAFLDWYAEVQAKQANSASARAWRALSAAR
jgi:hypothetical protein